MKIKCLGLSLVFVMLILSMEGAEGFEGPLQIKNSFPLLTSIGSSSLVSAVCESSTNVNLTYSSTYLVEESKNWAVKIDAQFGGHEHCRGS